MEPQKCLPACIPFPLSTPPGKSLCFLFIWWSTGSTKLEFNIYTQKWHTFSSLAGWIESIQSRIKPGLGSVVLITHHALRSSRFSLQESLSSGAYLWARRMEAFPPGSCCVSAPSRHCMPGSIGALSQPARAAITKYHRRGGLWLK